MNNILDNVVDLYIRVSTTEQAEEGFSVGAQEEKLRAYCKAYGYTIHAIHIDPGYSGANMDRPGLKQVIYDVEHGLCKKVIVWKLDRLSRSQKDTMILLEDVFLANDCHFVSIMESFDTSTPIGRCIVGILAAFAQMERENIKIRTAMGRQAKVKLGHYFGNKPPIGYVFNTAADGTVISNDLIVDPCHAKIVKDIFKWYLSGWSINGIARHLAEQGIGDYKWNHPTSIRRVLSNPVYMGKIRFNDGMYDGIHEAIISETDWYMAAAMLQHQKEASKRPCSYRTKTGCHSNYMLAGLLYCGDCGARMYARKTYKGSTTKKYQCYSVTRSVKSMIRSDHCTNREHPYTVEQLDEIVLHEIKKLALDKTQFEEIASKPSDKSEDAKIYKERLDEVEKQIKRLMNLYQTGLIELSDITDRLEALNTEKQSLTANLDELVEPADDIIDTKSQAWAQLESFPAILEAGDMESVHRIVNALIDKVVVLNRDVTIYWSFS